ncbi:MAG: N-6 DNA methylase [Elusimicrobiota bacterium]|jgi:adenine-specific DNA-methyltransferase|nr:N-6 DNA methylase [Elusimicrobiota bacterium]
MNAIKTSGKVYTPSFIVGNMLDFIGYSGKQILKKHIIDNSCGDGAFLIGIVERYCKEFLKQSGNLKKLKTELENYICGIEIDKNEVAQCLNNLDKTALHFNLKNIVWNIKAGDALEIQQFNKKMDFVIGNPPYIRVHNLNDKYNKVKEFSFAQSGMTDIYIVFFEIGFKMLNEKGKMCLITPSSFFKSKSGAALRKYIQTKRNLSKIIDLEHCQVFEAVTYSAVTLFDNCSNFSADYFIYDEVNKKPHFIDNLKYEEFFIDGKIFLAKREHLKIVAQIEAVYQNTDREIIVKNGFATLSDDAFIGDIDIDDPLIIDIVKASTGRWKKCIFPYRCNGEPISEAELKKHTAVYNYLLSKKSLLLKRDVENRRDWFLFGRSQAIKDVYKYKIAVSQITKDIDSIKINEVLPGQAVYSGLYILSPFSFAEIQAVILTQDFIEYLKLLKNYKSGGYFTFSSLELEKYLNYKLKGTGKNERCVLFKSAV